MKKPKTATYEADPGEVSKVLLLFSGGLDTTILMKWIQDMYKTDVITLTLDLGQPGIDLKEVKQKALKLGALKAYVIDAKKEFAEHYISKAIKANALYQGQYPLSTAIGRPLICKYAAEIAEKEGCDAIAHGSTGKGNDQVRLDAGIITLNPKLKVIAPVRDYDLTRDVEIDFAKKHNIPIAHHKMSQYSTDENIWGRSIECGILEDPSKEPPKDIYLMSIPPEFAPDKPETITLEFEKGIPIALDNMKMELNKLIEKLNLIAGKHGIGMVDMVEDRIVGLKSREIYECPAAITILTAHKDLEKFTCTIHQNSLKPVMDQKWSEMAYYGLWYDPLMGSLNAFIDKANEKVTGMVKVKLFKGTATTIGRSSPYGLYDHKLASYTKGQTFNQAASTGFIELWSLQTKMANQIKEG
ncbi:MAG: argininosuccinate synthase [Nanoarchaeota archaeon]|nr:argininosuccinate synthase [Nanoarchaeota archaeon]